MATTIGVLLTSLLAAIVVGFWFLIFIGIDNAIFDDQMSDYLANRFRKFINKGEG